MLKNYALHGKCLVLSDAPNPLVQVYVNPSADESNALRRLLEVDEHTLSSTLDPDADLARRIHAQLPADHLETSHDLQGRRFPSI